MKSGTIAVIAIGAVVLIGGTIAIISMRKKGTVANIPVGGGTTNTPTPEQTKQTKVQQGVDLINALAGLGTTVQGFTNKTA